MFSEHIWPVTLKAKGLSGNRDKGIPPGSYRLCLTNTDVSLIRLYSDKPDVEVPVCISLSYVMIYDLVASLLLYLRQGLGYVFDRLQDNVVFFKRFSWNFVDFYRANICEGGLGSRNSVRPSVRLSRACIVTKLNDALQIFFIPHERAITLRLWHQEWLVGDAPFPLKSAFKVTHPPSKNADFDRFPLITSQP